MEIFIDEQKVDVTLDSERTVNDVLVGIEKNCAAQNATIVEIEINGESIPADKIDALCSKPIEDVYLLKLSTIAALDIIDSLKNLTQGFSRLEQELPKIAFNLQNGGVEQSFDLMVHLADVLDEFCHLINFCALFPEFFKAFTIDGKSPENFLVELAPILLNFCSAIEKIDIVMIGDLAEYEISPRISALAVAVKGL